MNKPGVDAEQLADMHIQSSKDLVERQVHREPTTLSLIAMAIDKGLDPDRMTKLYDLHERHEKSEALKAYSAAMNECQKEMPAVVKDKENKHTKTWYATMESVNVGAKPIYTRHGFALSFGEEKADVENYIRTFCQVNHCDGHTERFHVDLPADGQGIQGNANMTRIHGKASTFSYAKRYLVCMIFNITIADEDDDGNAGAVKYIDGDQIARINDLLVASMSPLKGFLDWLGIESLDKLPVKDFAMAVQGLETNLRTLQKKQAAKGGTK